MNKVITVSREYGSGGRVLAKALAEKFGVPFYDKELIRMAAQESGISLELVEETGEYVTRGWMFGVAMPNIYSGSVMDMLPAQDRVYVAQSNIIREIAEKGPCVIVGRSADYILRERADCFNVFVHAPTAFKLQRVLEAHPDWDEKTAKKTMEKRDKQRAAHCRHYTDSVWGAAQNYHLALDSGKLGLDRCIDLIALAVGN